MNNKIKYWTIALSLIAVGFYFGRYFGALFLSSLYYYLVRRKKIKATVASKKSIHWASEVLGVSQNTDYKNLKKARQRLINRYHPDRLAPNASENDRKQANEKINQINRAFEALTKKYDEK